MSRDRVLFAIVLAAIASLSLSAYSQQSTSKSASAKSGSKAAVQEITLPNVAVNLAPGPNLETYQSHCLLCHSNRYVEIQPRFSRAVWDKEVKKMVDVYGAPINASDQQAIVEYLVAIRGPAESK